MKIILDVMSGDHAPKELLRGASLAREEYGSDILIVGREADIYRVAHEENISLEGLQMYFADDVISMEDQPTAILRQKKNCSMAVGLRLLAEGKGDAFVSAGNTGALTLGATSILRRVPGIGRAGIATIMPLRTPVLLMDSGANLEVSPVDLVQFAKMGEVFMGKVYDVRNPRVGLLNNGAEPVKGRPLQIEAYRLLSDSDVNFVGNVEAKDVPFSACDVLVTDGFSGNILLKFLEGMGRFMLLNLKDMFYSSTKAKLSAFMMKDKVSAMKQRFDAAEYGGAPLLGISRPVIKAHGSSNARAIKNAVRQAESFVRTGVCEEIAKWAETHSSRTLGKPQQEHATEKNSD